MMSTVGVATLSDDAEEKTNLAGSCKDGVLHFIARPLPVAFVSLAIGYILGRQQVGSDALHSTKSNGGTTDWISNVLIPDFVVVRTIVLSLALAWLVGREVWRNIPQWIKRQLARSRPVLPGETLTQRAFGLGEEDSNDMTSLSVLRRKLQSLFDLATTQLRLDDQDRKENSHLEVALVVLLRFIGQLKKHRADLIDSWVEVEESVAASSVLEGYDQIFELADLAYNEIPDGQTLGQVLLSSYGYELLRHDPVSLPGSAAHYIALDRKKKLAVIAVKGTSSLEDILTDCCGVAMEYNSMRCHDGILTASRRLVDAVETVVDELLIPCGFKVLLTGHSLGAGVAALAGILLRPKVGNHLEVVAFASPPIVDYQSATACQDFVTTVVNKSDVIPRSSLANLGVLKSFLVDSIRPRLTKRGIIPADLTSTAALVQFLTTTEDDKDESTWIMRADETVGAMQRAFDKVPVEDQQHLYVPGRVIFMYNLLRKNHDGKKAMESW